MSKRLNRISFVFAMFALTLSLSAFSGQSAGSQQTITGEVIDSLCAPSGSHAAMIAKTPNMGGDAASCARQCAKIGARYVLLDHQTGKVYQVEDQAKVAQFAGHRVKVSGTLTATGIKVTNINAIG